MFKIILKNEINNTNLLDKTIKEKFKNDLFEKFENHDNFNIMSIDWYDVKNKILVPSQITIIQEEKCIYFVCEDSHSYELIHDLELDYETSDLILYKFFYNLIKDDFIFLENLEDEITEVEDSLITSSKMECANEIIYFRRQLLQLKKYYEQLNIIFEGITHNRNYLISKDTINNFIILDTRIDRLYSNVLNIRDYVSQLREAYQAQIDIEQNNIMRVFTVITAIFLPLTLIVGWYGMNLKIPEFNWNYGYVFVICLSISISLICICIFKKMKWF